MARNSNQNKVDELAKEILRLAKNILLANMRFLDVALAKLEYAPFDGYMASDGATFFYGTNRLFNVYASPENSNNQIITRDYLHLLLHCIFRHMYVDEQLDLRAWNLACDITVENIINDFNLSCTFTLKEQKERELINKIKINDNRLTAEKIYKYIRESFSESQYKIYEKEFVADDHFIWYERKKLRNIQKSDDFKDNKSSDTRFTSESKNSLLISREESAYVEIESELKTSVFNKCSGSAHQQTEGENSDESLKMSKMEERDYNGVINESQMQKSIQEWKKISERMATEMEAFTKQRGDQMGNLLQNIADINRERYDYTEFLKRFATLHEEMKINDDEFDYIYYTYGLQLYNNLLLIEPLENKEVKLIREFVIAIDTSGSVQGELVQKFVQKTYNIMKSQETFFTKINVHIIQCDAEIQHDDKITSQEEFNSYIKDMKLFGFGGTDFRPIFNYVNNLIKTKEFTHLKGMVYFTNGYGVFPHTKPEYESAFVFMRDDDVVVPSWAIKVILDKDNVERL